MAAGDFNSNIENIGGSPSGAGGQVYYKNRDGSSSDVIIITTEYIFINLPSGAGEIVLDKNKYPYIKIDSVYYINDGAKWEYKNGDNSASMLHYSYSYLDKGNRFLNKARSFYLTSTAITNEDTFYADGYSGKVSLPTVGKYGIKSKRFQYLSQATDERWQGEGYQFSVSQNYGKVSATNVKNLGLTETITREVVLENFTGAKNQKWAFKIFTGEGNTNILEVKTYNLSSGSLISIKNYILGEHARVYLYQRPAASVTRTIKDSFDVFPNYIPMDGGGSSFNANYAKVGSGVLKDYIYPYMQVYGYDTFSLGFKYFPYDNRGTDDYSGIEYTDYVSEENGQSNGQRIMQKGCLDYVCDCTCNPITYKVYDETLTSEIVINPNKQMFTDGFSYTKETQSKDLCLGVLMDKYEYAPPYYSASNNIYFRSACTTGWSKVGGLDTSFTYDDHYTFSVSVNGYYMPNVSSLESFDIWGITNGTQYVTNTSTKKFNCDCFWPRLRGILKLANYSQLHFLENPNEVAHGSFTINDNANQITNGLELYTVFLRKFSLIPGIAKISGWDLTSSDSSWNIKRSITLSDKAKVFRKIHSKPETGSYWFDSKTVTGNFYTSIGFEREGYEEECAYCLTIEYVFQPITYTYEIKDDTLIFTFTNPNETEIVVKPGSDYGPFDESTWGRILPNGEGYFQVSSISNVLSYTQNPYIEYYDPYQNRNVKVLLAKL